MPVRFSSYCGIFLVTIGLFACASQRTQKSDCPEKGGNPYVLHGEAALREQKLGWGVRIKRLEIRDMKHYLGDSLIGSLQADSNGTIHDLLTNTIVSASIPEATEKVDSTFDRQGRLIRMQIHDIHLNRPDTTIISLTYNSQNLLQDSIVRAFDIFKKDSVILRYRYDYDANNRPWRMWESTSEGQKGLQLRKVWSYSSDSRLMATFFHKRYSLLRFGVQQGKDQKAELHSKEYPQQSYHIKLIAYDKQGRQTGIFDYRFANLESHASLEAELWDYAGDTVRYQKYSGQQIRDSLNQLYFPLDSASMPDPYLLQSFFERQLLDKYPDEETLRLLPRNLLLQELVSFAGEKKMYFTYVYDRQDSLISKKGWSTKVLVSGGKLSFPEDPQLTSALIRNYSHNHQYVSERFQNLSPKWIDGKSQMVMEDVYHKEVSKDKFYRPIEEELCHPSALHPDLSDCVVTQYEYEVSCTDSTVFIEEFQEGSWRKKERKIFDASGQLLEHQTIRFIPGDPNHQIHQRDTTIERTERFTYDHKGQKISYSIYEGDSMVQAERWEIKYYQ